MHKALNGTSECVRHMPVHHHHVEKYMTFTWTRVSRRYNLYRRCSSGRKRAYKGRVSVLATRLYSHAS